MAICLMFVLQTAGCAHWKEIPRPEHEAAAELEGRQVKLRKGTVVRVVDVTKLRYPKLEVSERDVYGNPRPVTLDLRDFDEVEVLQVDEARTAFLLLGIFVGAAVVFGAAVFAYAIHSH